MQSPTTLTIRRPDDWHVHLRDGAVLEGVLPYTARQFARAIVMPNLNPPMTDCAGVAAYRARIMAALPAGIPSFEKACLTFNALQKNKGMVPQDVSVIKTAAKRKAAADSKPAAKKAAARKPAAGKKPAAAK